jgi:hypothetical protein
MEGQALKKLFRGTVRYRANRADGSIGRENTSCLKDGPLSPSPCRRGNYLYCFADCENLETVILHERTKMIQDHAFAECPKLREVVLPNSLETIERYAFKGCSALNSLYIGPNVSLIEAGVFEDCTNLTVIVQAGSYAEKYAVEHEIAMEIKRI